MSYIHESLSSNIVLPVSAEEKDAAKTLMI